MILVWSPSSRFPFTAPTSALVEPLWRCSLHIRLRPPYLLPWAKSTASVCKAPPAPCGPRRHFPLQAHSQVALLLHPYTSLMFSFLTHTPPSPSIQIREGRADGIYIRTFTYPRVFLVFFFSRALGFSLSVTNFQTYKVMGSGCSRHVFLSVLRFVWSLTHLYSPFIPLPCLPAWLSRHTSYPSRRNDLQH